MRNFIKEFKTFALRGNMMDMAVGVVIGGAFSSLVSSLTDNFIHPILQFLSGAQTYSLKEITGFAASFLSSLINFFIMAFILFCLMRTMNKIFSLAVKNSKKPETTKECPFCKSKIDIAATRCPHCTSHLVQE